MRVWARRGNDVWVWAGGDGCVKYGWCVFDQTVSAVREAKANSDSVALHQSTTSELAGIISIGAGLPSEAPAALVSKCKTPVLICAGSSSSSVTSASEDKLKRSFEHVEVKRYRRAGDSMPSNRDEMLPIMHFFSRRLKSRKGVPQGSMEVS